MNASGDEVSSEGKQYSNIIAGKPHDPSSIPGTYMAEGGNPFSTSCPLTSTHVLHTHDFPNSDGNNPIRGLEQHVQNDFLPRSPKHLCKDGPVQEESRDLSAVSWV